MDSAVLREVRVLESWAWVVEASSVVVEGSDGALRDLADARSVVRVLIWEIRDVFSVLLVSSSALRVEMRLSSSDVVDSTWKRECLRLEMSSSRVSIVACFVLSCAVRSSEALMCVEEGRRLCDCWVVFN